MTKYQVKPDLKGVVMIGESSFKPGQQIVDGGADPRISAAIAKYLKMGDNSPIVAVGEKEPEAKLKDKLKDKPGAK